MHLGHEGILRHTNRPWTTTEEMDEALIRNFCDVVGRRDRTYILGDFAWKNHNRYLARLPGEKILIRGNHDEMPKDALRNFTEVHDILDRKFNHQHIVMFHYPMRGWPDASRGAWHLFGHFHGRMEEDPGGLCFDVGVDVWDYKPVPLDVVFAKMNAKKAHREQNPRPLRTYEEMMATVAAVRAVNSGFLGSRTAGVTPTA